MAELGPGMVSRARMREGGEAGFPGRGLDAEAPGVGDLGGLIGVDTGLMAAPGW